MRIDSSAQSGAPTMEFALDTNLLVYPMSRRLLHGIALEAGISIYVLPEVERELIGLKKLRNAEMYRLCRRAEVSYRDVTKNEAHYARTLEMLDKACTEWFESELSAPNTVFARTTVDAVQANHIRLIADSFPPLSFKQTNARDELSGDRLIIAQAAFFDVDILSTNNLRTIDHDQVNVWLRGKGLNRDLICSPSKTLETLSNGDIEQVYGWFLTHGTNRVFESEDENRAEVVRSLHAISAAGFDYSSGVHSRSDAFASTMFRLSEFLKRDTQFKTRFESAVLSESRKQPIETELRLNRIVNKSVELPKQSHAHVR